MVCKGTAKVEAGCVWRGRLSLPMWWTTNGRPRLAKSRRPRSISMTRRAHAMVSHLSAAATANGMLLRHTTTYYLFLTQVYYYVVRGGADGAKAAAIRQIASLPFPLLLCPHMVLSHWHPKGWEVVKNCGSSLLMWVGVEGLGLAVSGSLFRLIVHRTFQ